MVKGRNYELPEEWMLNRTVIKTIAGMVGANFILRVLDPALTQISDQTSPMVLLLVGVFMLAWAVKKEKRR